MHQVHGGTEVVKVLDFGVAKFLQDQHNRAGESLFETNRPMLVGTVQYMSPEPVLGNGFDGRSDLYALGIMLYECLVGERPFDGDTPIVTLSLHLDGEIPELPANVPAPLAMVVKRLLSKDPDDRPADAEETAGLLEGFFNGELPIVVAQPILPSKPKPPSNAQSEANTTRAAPPLTDTADPEWNAFPEPETNDTSQSSAPWTPPPRTRAAPLRSAMPGQRRGPELRKRRR